MLATYNSAPVDPSAFAMPFTANHAETALNIARAYHHLRGIGLIGASRLQPIGNAPTQRAFTHFLLSPVFLTASIKRLSDPDQR